MLIWLWKQFESQSRRLLVPATGDLQRHWGLWGQPCSLGARPARSRGRVRVIQHRGTLTSYRKFPNFSFVLYLAHELQEAVCPRPKLLATISRDVTVWMVPPSKREAAGAEAICRLWSQHLPGRRPKSPDPITSLRLSGVLST